MSDTPKVLIVDDDETSREYLSALLDALGFGAEGAASGREALERLSRLPALDVVILDVIMPELDGVETLRRYRAGGGKAPVVMCSALDEADTVVRAMRAGASDYITKPFNAEELREILERVAGGQRATTVATPADAARVTRAATSLGDEPVDAAGRRAHRSHRRRRRAGADHGRVGRRQGRRGARDPCALVARAGACS